MIIRYNKNFFEKIEDHLLDYHATSDYRFLFSSKEWIRAYIEVYNPSESFLIFSKGGNNYFSLTIGLEGFVFTGAPFNDFNGFQISRSDDFFDFPEIITRLSGFHQKFIWEELFEKKQINSLFEHSVKRNIWKEPTVSLKITKNTSPFESVISKRILKNYNKFAGGVVFKRVNGNELSEQKHLLQMMFEYRQTKLLNQRLGENSPSLGHNFKLFIEKLLYSDTISENIIFDYCYDHRSGDHLAFSLSFLKDNKTICYLRAHAPSKNQVSFGLILDYWSITTNFKLGIDTIDLTRGNEPYKYRLGAKEYFLENLIFS